ncbi:MULTISPECIES: protein-methionine-sulfoxide reductase heme-binding subunit MsrQ [Gluconobacter]|uniref:Protein-methionine-sulfoxide reductase heme-binding subunit MsrQ n=1 Tax=Gluconobacter cadivus TaxID=2728101 RepID=A0ABR9YSX8_9PROT|nr:MULTISPECIES: protein-methionine-sulfoxide reductase heme-binding subunit MsrQ [Gluconobacter]MBF0887642.1 protein-methionine-sulfoxide reductase heme-binding subunit MsrQ [Gluconobacter cadivus]MBS1058712.1 protein-methionine-sulfoxide reductase heme-binding subunit MsrQ [Gluconobacter sp. Dm-44]
MPSDFVSALRAVKRHWRVILYPIGMIPAAWLVWQGQHGALGADPVNVFERSLGLWAFRFLLACLVLAPLKRFAGINLLRYRRLTGLLAFFYASLHVLAYIGLDHGFDWGVLWTDITRRPFIILGMSALVLLVPLALTSNAFSMRLMKRRWKVLHRLIYLAAVLAGIHFFLSFKTLNAVSAPYLAGLALLLLCRVLPEKRR